MLCSQPVPGRAESGRGGVGPIKVGRSERARLPPQRVLQLLLGVEVKRADQEVAQPDHLRARAALHISEPPEPA